MSLCQCFASTLQLFPAGHPEHDSSHQPSSSSSFCLCSPHPCRLSHAPLTPFARVAVAARALTRLRSLQHAGSLVEMILRLAARHSVGDFIDLYTSSISYICISAIAAIALLLTANANHLQSILQMQSTYNNKEHISLLCFREKVCFLFYDYSTH